MRLTWPDYGVNTDGASCGDADEDVFDHRLVDSDEDDVGYASHDLHYFMCQYVSLDSLNVGTPTENRCDPGGHFLRVDQPADEDQASTAKGVCWLRERVKRSVHTETTVALAEAYHGHQLCNRRVRQAQLVDDGRENRGNTPSADSVEHPDKGEGNECWISEQ